MFKVPEKFRVTDGYMKSTEKNGNNGVFIIAYNFNGIKQSCLCIASDGGGWEHVSASRKDRCLTWEEMCIIKSIFWEDSDCVIQYHPPKDQYVNNHEYCLHLWRPIDQILPMPPKIFVGI